MSAIHSGPPVLTADDVADHYSSPPRMLFVVFGIAGLVFAGAAIGAGAVWVTSLIRRVF